MNSIEEWYDASYEAVPGGVMTAWRANNKSEDGKYILSGTASPYNPADGNLAYYVYLDMTDGKPAQAIYWNYTNDPTSVDDISQEAENRTPDIVDVYNMQGVCVRHSVPVSQALDNLPEGIYIYGGHKYMVR